MTGLAGWRRSSKSRWPAITSCSTSRSRWSPRSARCCPTGITPVPSQGPERELRHPNTPVTRTTQRLQEQLSEPSGLLDAGGVLEADDQLLHPGVLERGDPLLDRVHRPDEPVGSQVAGERER